MKDKNTVRKEVGKHLRNNMSRSILYAFVFIAALLVIIGISILYQSPINRNISAIESLNCTSVIESNLCYSEFSCNYKMDNLITFCSMDNNRMNVNTYMDLDGVSTILHDVKLSENEVAISKRIAEKLNVSQGDKVYLELPLYDESLEYTVAEIIPFVWDYYEVEDNRDFSVACIGYNQSIERKTLGKYISFLNTEQVEAYMDKEYSYSETFNIQAEKEQLRLKTVVCTTIIMSLLALIVAVYSVIFYRIVLREIVKYRMDNYAICFLKKLYRLDYAVYCVLPLMLLLVISVIAIPLCSISAAIAELIAVMLFVTVLGFEIGGRTFERAD